MATPIRHRQCGEVAMWYVGDPTDEIMRAEQIVYLDGSRPQPRSAIPPCPRCGMQIGVRDLMRRFDEDIDPGFDIETVVKKQAA